MTLSEQFVMEGYELVHWWAATIKTATVRQAWMEENASLQFAANFHCPVEECFNYDELKPKPPEK